MIEADAHLDTVVTQSLATSPFSPPVTITVAESGSGIEQAYLATDHDIIVHYAFCEGHTMSNISCQMSSPWCHRV